MKFKKTLSLLLASVLVMGTATVAANAAVDDDSVGAYSNQKYLETQAAGLPMRSMSDPEECVGTALFLAAPASDFLTGNILYPDGGLTAIG